MSEVRLHFGHQTLPGTSSLTRPGNVLCPHKKHPASARALEPRLPRFWLPWPRRSRPRSRSLPSDAAVWLSYAVSGGSALSWWLYDQLLLVGTLALWYVHPFPPLACNHMTIPGLYSTPPLNHSIRPYLSPTYEPLRPDIVAIWVAGDLPKEQQGGNRHTEASDTTSTFAWCIEAATFQRVFVACVWCARPYAPHMTHPPRSTMRARAHG